MHGQTNPDPAIPQALTSVRAWCTWTLRPNAGGRPTKVPSVSTLDRAAWLPFASVATTPRTASGGIGIVTTDLPGGLVALDVDGCRDPQSGELSPWAAALIAAARSYTEVTPSGSGLRVWLAVKKPWLGRCKFPMEYPPLGGKRPEVQVFRAGTAGYVTVTGARHAYCPTGIRAVDELAPVLVSILPAVALSEAVPVVALPVGRGDEPSASEITEAVLAMPHGTAFVNANWKAIRPHKSASEVYHELVHVALDAARGHAGAVVDWLLHCTAWGAGRVDDSADPARYARRAWVQADVLRACARHTSGADAFAPLADLPAGAPPTATPPAPPALLIPHAEFLARRATQLFLVDGLLPRTGIAQMFGDPGCGKTPFALSLALHVAGGRPTWFGAAVDRAAPVVYLVGEDANGLAWRAQAEQEALGVADPRLYWSTQPGQLCDAEDAARWIAAIRAIAGPEVALVVVDTQSRNFGAGNENDTQDMTQFVAHVARIAETLGCLVVLVHHTGHTAKDRGRGSSVLFGALDACYEIQREGMAVVAVARKSKNWQEPAPLRGALVPRIVGRDAKGRDVSAVTLDTAPAAPAFEMPDGVERLATDALLRAVFSAIVELDSRPTAFPELAARADVSVDTLKRRLVPELQALDLVEVERGAGRGSTVFRVTAAGENARVFI